MSALGDSIYILSILISFSGLVFRNYLIQLLGFIFGAVGFLVFAENLTDILFSSSTFFLGFIPLAIGLLDFALFFNWLKEERL